MHEVSLALNLLDLAQKQCADSGYNKITSISLKIGIGAGVMKDALEFAFDAVKKGTIADEAALIIEDVPFSGCCHHCKKDFTSSQEFVLFCPYCGSHELEFYSGKDLNIFEMEVDE